MLLPVLNVILTHAQDVRKTFSVLNAQMTLQESLVSQIKTDKIVLFAKYLIANIVQVLIFVVYVKMDIN